MCCDDIGDFLVTGDTQGYIKVWDISEYCIEEKPSGNYDELFEHPLLQV